MEAKYILLACVLLLGFAALIWTLFRVERRATKESDNATIRTLTKTLQSVHLNFNAEDVITRSALIEILTSIKNNVIPNNKELRRQEMQDYELELNEVLLRYDADDLPARTKGTVGSALRTERGTYVRIFVPVEGTKCRNAYYLIDTDNMEVIEQPNLA